MADNQPDRTADPDPAMPPGGDPPASGSQAAETVTGEAPATATVSAPAPAAASPPRRLRRTLTASAARSAPFMRRGPSGVRRTWRLLMRLLASAVVMASVVIAVIFAIHITFVVFKANPGNGIVQFVNAWASRLAWNFRDLFVPRDPRVATLANYGIAAVACLIAGRIAAAIIRRLG
jgi:hypothetical protein